MWDAKKQTFADKIVKTLVVTGLSGSRPDDPATRRSHRPPDEPAGDPTTPLPPPCVAAAAAAAASHRRHWQQPGYGSSRRPGTSSRRPAVRSSRATASRATASRLRRRRTAWSPYDPQAKSKIAAGLLGIFLGGFGVHRFYLGFTKIGIIQIVVTIFTCGIGSLWGFVEGILYLVGSNGYTTDANGRPLRD